MQWRAPAIRHNFVFFTVNRYFKNKFGRMWQHMSERSSAQLIMVSGFIALFTNPSIDQNSQKQTTSRSPIHPAFTSVFYSNVHQRNLIEFSFQAAWY